MKKALWLLVATLILFAGCGGAPGPADQPTPTATPAGPGPEEATRIRAGEDAPDFTVTTLDGDRFTLSEHRGKVVVLAFFATWCPPCREELPVLERDVWQAFRDRKFALLAIGREHSPDELRPFVAETDLSMPVAPDPDRSVYGAYADAWIPRTVVIGPDGRVLRHLVDFNPADLAEAVDLIRRELDELGPN